MRNEQSTERSLTPVSGQQLAHLLETLPHAFFVLDAHGTILYANATAARSAGKIAQKLPGKTFWKCAPQFVTTTLYQAVMQAQRTRQPLQITYHSPVTQNWLSAQLSPTDEGLALFFHEESEPVQTQHSAGRNEQMYHELLESFADGVLILTPEGLILDINQRPLVDSQVSREEVVGTSFIDFPAWSYDPLLQQQLRAAIEQAKRGEVAHLEIRIHPVPEMTLDIAMVITSHRAANQQIEYLICAGRDITERKRVEEEQRTLIDTIPHFIWIMNPDGSAEYGNRRWVDYSARSPAELQGDGWMQSLHPDDRSHVLQVWQHSVRTGEPYEVEHRMMNGSTGVYRWFLARGMPLKDAQGKILRWLGTCTDIDDQKRVEEALRLSQERVNVLMNSSIIGIFIAEDEQVVEANDTYLRMTGYTREDLQAGNVNWFRMTPPEYVAQTQCAHQELIASQHVMRYEKEYLCKDGSRLPVVVGGVALQSEPLVVIGFVLDNSARHELEQRKDDFISMASHELKTPLTALKLQTQLIKVHLARQGQHETLADLTKIEESARRLERLLQDLLDVSRMQAGGLEYSHETVDLYQLLRELATTLQQVHPTHSIVVRGVPALTLLGDRGRLEQVFTNLITNAIKYSPQAQLVEIDMGAAAETVVVRVRDHGIGIPPEQRQKIFERFYRATEARQKKLPGLGMGLHIALEIVKHHGGTIAVDGAPGQGSVFQVTLPVRGDCSTPCL